MTEPVEVGNMLPIHARDGSPGVGVGLSYSIWPSRNCADHRVPEPQGPPGCRGLVSRSSRRRWRGAAELDR